MSLEQLFAGRNLDIAAAQTQMRQLMAAEGLPYGDRTMTYNSRLAQEFAKWVEHESGSQAIHEALYKAYFVENANLASHDTLIDIAKAMNLSADAARETLRTRSYRSQVDADWTRARAIGITSVPTFLTGTHGLVGARSYEELAGLLQTAGARTRQE